jgi:multiple sugar transport system permease protein
MAEEKATSSKKPEGKIGTLAVFFRKIKEIRREKWGDVSGYLFVFPLLAMWLVFNAYPYLRGIIIPFQNFTWLNPKSWSPLNSFNGLDNFIELIKDPWVHSGAKNAFFLWLSWFPFTFCLSIFTAATLAKIRGNKISAAYRVIITLPWVIPMAAAMPMWGQIYEPEFGYLRHLLSNVLKVWPNPPVWTVDKFWFWPALGIACSWKGFGYYMLMFLLGFYNIPEELYEAARLDGANVWQEFRHISLPGIRNILFLFVVTNVGFIGGGMIEMMIFGSGPGGQFQTLNLYAFNQAFSVDWRLGYGSAIMFFTGVVNLIVISLVFKFFKIEKA